LSSAAAAQSLPAPDDHHWIGTETVVGRTGSFDFVGGFPTQETVSEVNDLLRFNRATEVYLQNVSAVSMYKFRKGLADFGVKTSNQVALWSELMDAKTLLLTANSDTVYTITFLDLQKDGPTVVELPPKMLGLYNDMWMRYIADGGIAGPDKGAGGKFLFVPPGYQGDLPKDGYFQFKSPTYGIWMLMRAVDPDPKAASERSRQIRVYPLAQAASPPAMEFVDASGKYVDTIHGDDISFFEELNELVQQEPADAIDSLRRFYLASIGIEKGKPFAPDAKSRALLTEAARTAAATARVVAYGGTDADAIVYPGRHWQWAFVGGSYLFDSQGYENIDRRGAFAYAATGNTPAMASKVVGAGSQYMWAARDSKGQFLDGKKSYQLHIPASPPVKDFWSVTVYDPLSRSMLQNGQKSPTVSKYTNPEQNADGSVDIYFGPSAPAGKERNWVKTLPDRGWFPILRFYGPLQPFFDKSWRAEDIVETP